jgi:hypothetical protein
MERRIGERVPVHGAVLEWYPPGSKVRRRGRHANATSDAAIADVSVTGARVVAQTNDKVRVGTVLAMVVNGVAVKAVVRYMSPTAHKRYTQYGVEFLQPTPQFQAMVALYVAGRPWGR